VLLPRNTAAARRAITELFARTCRRPLAVTALTALTIAPLAIPTVADARVAAPRDRSAEATSTGASLAAGGVVFNPQLGYPDPTIRTGIDATTGAPAVNHVSVDASQSGFASVWVDWNLDGDFDDAGERVVDAAAVAAGDNDLTFARAQNPDDIRTAVRVRFSTDANAIHDPTGTAPDGESADYPVLVERLIAPASCSPVDEQYYAMTFLSATDRTGAGGPGSTTRYPDVTVVGGQPVDMVMTVVEGQTQSHPPNGMDVLGDDAAWNIPGVGTTTRLRYSFYRAGTSTPIAVNGIWTVNDMDQFETARWNPGTELADWAISPGSEVDVTFDEPGGVVFDGTRSGDGAEWSRFQVWFTGRTSLDAYWSGFQNSGYGIDGDGDVPLTPTCDDYGDAPDSYGTLLASDGPHHLVTPDLMLGTQAKREADGQPTVGANGDDNNGTDVDVYLFV
jgi:hypothetical protein